MTSRGQAVRHLGSVILAAVLLGLPRALDGRTFGAQRSVYVELATWAPELNDFSAELTQVIGEEAHSLATRRTDATVVVELRGVSRGRGADEGVMEAASFVIEDRGRRRPVVLHYRPEERAEAARALLALLAPRDA